MPEHPTAPSNSSLLLQPAAGSQMPAKSPRLGAQSSKKPQWERRISVVRDTTEEQAKAATGQAAKTGARAPTLERVLDVPAVHFIGTEDGADRWAEKIDNDQNMLQIQKPAEERKMETIPSNVPVLETQ